MLEGEEFLRWEDIEDSKLKAQISDLKVEIEPFGGKVKTKGLGRVIKELC